MIRVLLVEDEAADAREIMASLVSRCGAEVVLARSKDSAREVIEQGADFDLIVCDLMIPAVDGSLDVSEEHGHFIHALAQERLPGIPSIFFSGFARLENMRTALVAGGPVDLFGTGEMWPMVDVREKAQRPDFLERVGLLADHLCVVDAVEVTGAEDAPLEQYQARPLRVFTQWMRGSVMDVSPLGGLSSAAVMKGRVADSHGLTIARVVAKVDMVDVIRDELERYARHVAPRLGIGAFAHKVYEVLHGAGRYGAAFYRLADEPSIDLFDLIESDAETAARTVASLRAALHEWSPVAAYERATVGSLRSTRVRSERLTAFAAQLDELNQQTVEALEVEIPLAIQHGDLHGRNILVNDPGSAPIVIDYGDVGLAPAMLDPVTLELSCVLHEGRPNLSGWPDVTTARSWFDVDAYADRSPVSGVIQECRAWATSSSSQEQLAAMVYAQALRHLKFPGTNQAVALAIAGAAASVLLGD